jgi:Domain of unknown function (DUF6438)
MKTINTLVVSALTASIAVAAACSRQAPAASPAPVAAAEMPCWWTVYRSELPLDTVAANFVNAFSTLGLAGATSVRQGDTVWAHAGPTRIASRFGGTFAARAVAFQRGDLTLYRSFGTAEPPPGGWRKGYDSVTVTGGHISVVPASSGLGLCAAIASTAQNDGRAPKQPNGEETLAVWTSLPSLGDTAPLSPPPVELPTTARAGTTVTTTAIDLRPFDPAKADSIVLERSLCFGFCPAYRLRVSRSGEVLYRSRASRDTTHALASIGADKARELLDGARMLGLDALPDTIANVHAYCPNWPTDYPTATITVFVGQGSKHVVDYLGCDWAPVGLRVFESLVDSVAGTKSFLGPRVQPRR